jgi:hypothetical protein
MLWLRGWASRQPLPGETSEQRTAMSRYKGVTSKATIRREFPHDVVVPWEAVGGNKIPLVDIFFAQAGQPKHHSRLRKDDAEFYIYHFADAQTARSFQAMFGGEIIKPSGRGA